MSNKNMQKPYFEWVALSCSEIKERNSQKCECGKTSEGLVNVSESQNVTCVDCLPLSFDSFVPWRYVVNTTLVMKFKRFDPNWHL
jgi:hypothetical protein